ncbi:MAG: glycosyltransferase [Euryarchaeota archaeon]|nr:glycosyltransferase [Euryarchaeota archaeon]
MEKVETIPVFIGYDPREAIAFHTCVNSIIRHATQPVSIRPLALNLLSGYRETHTDGSNHFIYSRFLVPYMTGFTGRAIFIDGDMIVKADIAQLWQLADTLGDFDVAVVKHDYKTKMPIKYLGAKNEDYPRKNWSSVMLFNCMADACRKLLPEYIQNTTGAHLHRFHWTSDDRVAELPREWNWLAEEYDDNPQAKLVHYTLGTPCFHEFADTGMANDWHQEKLFTEYCQQRIDLLDDGKH